MSPPTFTAPAAPPQPFVTSETSPAQQLAARALPPLLQMSDGTPVTAPAQWPARRAQIVDVLQSQLFGRAPQIADKDVRFAVTKVDRNALGGAATLKQIKIAVDGPRGTLSFELILFTTNARRQPAPTMLLISHRGAANLDPTRAEKTEFWPVEELIARGLWRGGVSGGLARSRRQRR